LPDREKRPAAGSSHRTPRYTSVATSCLSARTVLSSLPVFATFARLQGSVAECSCEQERV
jgi:hypothetical protein